MNPSPPTLPASRQAGGLRGAHDADAVHGPTGGKRAV